MFNARLFACAHVLVFALAALTPQAAAQHTFDWTLDTATVQHVDKLAPRGVSYDWFDYLDADATSLPLADGLKVYGNGPDNHVFALTADTYRPAPPNANLSGNRLLFTGSASFIGAAWSHPTDFIRTAFDFTFDFTGGTIELTDIYTGFTLFDSVGSFLIGVGSGTSLGVFDPGAHTVSGLAFEDRFGHNSQNAVFMEWSVAIVFNWTGYGTGDTLDFFIPETSIDMQVIPAPGATATLALALVSLSRRRRA